MRPGSCCALALVLAAFLSGCQDDSEPDDGPASAHALPEDLCAEVPGSYASQWRLAETDHATENADDISTASCTMTGERAGEPVTFSVAITTYGDSAEESADDRMAAALETACLELEGSAAGELESDDTRCNVRTPAEPVELRGSVRDISRMVGIAGVMTIEMAHHGEAWQGVAPDVEGIAASINSRIGSP